MKKILMINHCFEPCQAIGAKRWSEFFTLLDQSEYEVTVLTANWKGQKMNNKAVHYIGEEIEYRPVTSVNHDFTCMDMLKHPSIYIRSIDRMMFYDSWLDEGKQWIDKHKDESYDIIIASYTPINAIRLGSYAKEVFNARYILDMRDMMSLQGQKKRIPLIHHLDQMLDRFWLRHVDEILVVGPTLQEKAKAFYKRPVHLIYNGFINKNYTPIEYRNDIKEKKKIVFSYLGTMGNKRNPKVLLEWLYAFFSEYTEFTVEINFASQDNPHHFFTDTRLQNITINWLGYLNKEMLNSLKLETDIFLLLEDINEEGKENITGKVFEYLLEQKPILTYCHPESDIRYVLQDSGIGNIVASYIECKNFLLNIINNKFKINHEKVLYYSKENQLLLLKEVLYSDKPA